MYSVSLVVLDGEMSFPPLVSSMLKIRAIGTGWRFIKTLFRYWAPGNGQRYGLELLVLRWCVY